LKGAPL
jgi:hypothetical protein